jgi:hypothetical protein
MILIDNTKTLRNNYKNNNYTDDIVEIPIKTSEIFDFKLIEKDKFKGLPVPYYYKILKKNDYLKKIFINDFYLNWSVINLPIYKNKLIMITPRPFYWKLTDCLELNKKWPSGNPKATQINKKHKVWGPALFLKINGQNLDKKTFIKEYYEISRLQNIKMPKNFNYNGRAPKNMQERYETCQNFIKLLIDKHIVTLETGYILMGTQLVYEYVYNKHPYYQAGPCFHAVSEYTNLFIQLTSGTVINKKHKKNKTPNYMGDILGNKPLYPKNFEEYDNEFKKYLFDRKLHYEHCHSKFKIPKNKKK